MGGGTFDAGTYYADARSRRELGMDDFAYSASATCVHASLDPKRINSKPFGKLESRDSEEHPESNAVLVEFDVTGSNYRRAVDAQKALCNLMTLLPKYLSDPQVAIAANDDFGFEPQKALQISDFESDNRVDEHLRNTILVKNGGFNLGESYDLVLYAAARKTVLDCFEKRGRKGYLFLFADEPFFDQVKASEVLAVFGDKIKDDIPIADIIAEVRKLYHVFVLYPADNRVSVSYNQYIELFGKEYVITLKHPSMICEVICSTIGINEAVVTVEEAREDLVALGVAPAAADDISEALLPLSLVRSLTRISDLPRGRGPEGGLGLSGSDVELT